MSDLKSVPNEDELRQGIELLFYAYRDFTRGPDEILEQYGFGRAHHRALHFIGGHSGITVAELLSILRITKQSLARVLSALIAQDFVRQQQGTRDRRQRQLFLTEKGRGLEKRIAALQQAKVAQAYRDAGAEAVAGYRKVLSGLIDDADRAQVLRAIQRG